MFKANVKFRGEVMIGKYVESPITNYLYAKATRELRPLSGTFELSPLCNFNCKMCYVHQKKCELKAQGKVVLPPSFWIDLAKQAKDEGMLFLLLTGGEPFLYDGFKEVYEAIYRLGFVISINTNGSLIDDGWIEFLKKFPPSRMNITLYGASNETYEELCGVKGMFDRVVQNILRLKRAGIAVKLNCSLTPSNAKDLEKIVKFSDEHQLILEIATYMFPPIRLDESKKGINHRFSPEEMAMYEVEKVRLQRGEDVLVKYKGQVLEGYCDIPECDSLCLEKEGSHLLCRAGRASFWTTWEGNLTPCGMMPVPKVSLRDMSFKEAWNVLVERTGAIRLAPECRDCKNQSVCHSCAGMAYAENADFTKRPKYLCEFVKSLKEQCENK